MGEQPETKCPLCGLPRPKGAKRCLCNYTFEYERESRPFRRIAAAGPTADGAPVLVLALIAALGAWLFMRTLHMTDDQATLGIFLAVAGVFAVAGGFFDWSFFMTSGRARRFVWLFGRGGARLVYGVIGGGLTGAGFALALA